MNTLAILIGLVLGVLTAGSCYVVSMVTAGLFGRTFYQLYARVLTSICSIMLLAPALRWLGMLHPEFAAYALTGAQYLVMGLLFYGVIRFNREHLKRLYLERKTATFFAFGTLANAAIVTLVVLHVAITGGPAWSESPQGYVGVGHYGPLLVILAAMVFHTDYHLKQAFGNPRRFSRFTFLGYAISFIGIGLSIIPYLGDALSQFSLATIEDPVLENFFSAQALLLAILLYGTLVTRYESIPPLFLLLLAIVAEYHVLVTQWCLEIFGTGSWGLASLPLFAGLAAMDHFFTTWTHRKRRTDDASVEQTPPEQLQLKFCMPFRWVEVGLAACLLVITLYSRFLDGGSPAWLMSTLVVYSCFFVGTALVRSEPRLIYVSGLLAALSAVFGNSAIAEPSSLALLGILSLLFSGTATLGDRGGLKLDWRAPLVNTAFLTAGITTIGVFFHHLVGAEAYNFQAVGILDALALLLSAATFSLCALQYRSQVPVFAAIAAVSLTVPPWCAAVGLILTLLASICKRSLLPEKAFALEGRVGFLWFVTTPMTKTLPALFVQPLSLGAIPLAILGLAVSAGHVWNANFSPTVMIGAVISAVVLALMNRVYRFPWLYVLSFLASYFAIHTVAQGLIFGGWPRLTAVAGHLLVASIISLISWFVAAGYAAWCDALLHRVAEDREPEIREQRDYHAGSLYDLSLAATLTVLAGTFITFFIDHEASLLTSMLLFSATAITTVIFGRSAFVYRSQLGSYLSLTAMTLTMAHAPTILDLAEFKMTAVAGTGLLAAIASYLACTYGDLRQTRIAKSLNWKKPLPYLRATGSALWFRPLGIYAMGCAGIAVLGDLGLDDQLRAGDLEITVTTPITLAFAAATYFFATRAFRLPTTYLIGIALIHAAVHASVAVGMEWFGSPTSSHAIRIFTSASLSLLGCSLALGYAWLINTKLEHTSTETQSDAMKRRTYYAGILQHFSFGTALVTLCLLLPTVIEGDAAGVTGWLHAGTALFLAMTFFAQAFIYASRVHSYATLAAACMGVLSLLGIFVETFDFESQVLSIAGIGFAFSLIAWGLESRHDDQRNAMNEYGARRFDCWQEPPWDWVSLQTSRWVIPMTQAAVLLASMATTLALTQFFGSRALASNWWLTVLPLYFASATFFSATRSRGIRLLTPIFDANPSIRQIGWSGERVERGALFVISLVLLVSAIHLTLHLTLLETLLGPAATYSAAISWHLLTGGSIVLLGWTVANLIVTRLSEQVRLSSGTPKRQDALAIYGGLLHQFAAVAGVLLFTIACTLGVPPQVTSLLTVTGLGLMTVFFVLASCTYRSPVMSYLGLLALGLGILHTAALTSLSFPVLIPLEPPSIALLGLGLMVSAGLAERKNLPRPITPEANALLQRPWLNPIDWKTDSIAQNWSRPLRDFSILSASAGLGVMLLYRWVWSDNWNVANEQAVVTYGCVAATFALAVHRYRTPIFCYAAATLVVFSLIPQMLIAGVPVSNLGIGLAALAVVFWLTGNLCERICSRRRNAGDESSALTLERIWQRPMIRSSAILALVAIAHSLFVWKAFGWSTSQTPIVVACFLGSTTLLLNARSLNLLHRVTPARWLVYLACTCLTGCVFALTSATASFNALGPVSAITAFALSITALILMDQARKHESLTPKKSDSRRTFAEPISHFACGLSLLSVTVSLIAIIGTVLGPWAAFGNPPERFALGDTPFLPAAFTLFLASIVSVLSARTEKTGLWLYPSVIFASVGLLLLAESQFEWSRGTLALLALGLMNLLAFLARLIRFRPAPIESMLGLNREQCVAPLVNWPLAFTASLLMSQIVMVASNLISSWEIPSDWPWLWETVLISGLFLHVANLKKNPDYIHLLVWSAVTGAIGYFSLGDAAISRSDLVIAAGFGWAAMALGLLAVSRERTTNNEQQLYQPLFTGVSHSALTLLYLLGSAIAIAPVILSSPAIPVGLAIGFISLCWLWMAWASGEEVLGYGALLGISSTVLYLGYGLTGFSLTRNPFTAFSLIGLSFLIYGANVLVSRATDSRTQVFLRPTYYLALLLPSALCFSLPINQPGPAALALLSTGAFYLLVARQSQLKWAMYVAAGCVNVAIYLWVPVAQEFTGLFQLYVIPAAITVIVFAQLHRHELNTKVLTSIRLAASGAILAVSTFEVFFSQDSGLLQFVAVLVISLIGIAAGIALRIKPFVYGGVAFLMMNVVGQLGIQFQYQGGVIRAIILIGVGLMILGTMIFFNVHRERILNSYRGFVSDQTWE